jgi:putative drug exporter of the RND superfamily
VFLLSQVAQHRTQEASDRDAVRLGLALASCVMSAAALIMIAVFGSFVLNGDPTLKRFGRNSEPFLHPDQG